MEINIKIEGLNQLTEALALIGASLAYQRGMANTTEAAVGLMTGATTFMQEPAPIQQTVPIQSQVPQSVPVQQQPVQHTQVDQPQAQGVPTQTQTYSMEQLAVAATQLVDAGRRQELVNLLTSFGVQALTALPKEQYGNFATQLRTMGARI